MEGRGERGSSTLPSRLSPFAQPFNPQPTLNSVANSCQQPFTPSLDDSQSPDPSLSLVGSFPDLNLEGDSVLDAPWDAYKYYGHQSDMGITDFPYDNPSDFDGQSCYYPWYPSLALQGNSMSAVPSDLDFDAMPLTKSSMPDYTQSLSGFDYVGQRSDGGDGPCNAEQDKRRDHHGNFFSKEASKACGSLQKQATQQALHVAEGSKPCGETSDNINMHGNLISMVLGGDNWIKSRGIERVTAESFPVPNSTAASFKFSTSSDMCSPATLQNIPQGQWSYPMPAVTGSSCKLNFASYERFVSQLDLSSAEHHVSLSPKKNSLPALSFGSQGTSTAVPALKPVFSVNADLSGINALNNNDNSSGCNPEEFFGLNGCNPISLKKPHVLLNAKGKEVYLDKSLIVKGNEIKSDKPISGDGTDPLRMVKSELQPHGIKLGVSVESSVTLDENDSDVDSPCWKGTLDSCWSPFRVSESVSSQCLEKELETSNSLNPLAPHFFPSNVKGSIDCHENECGRGDFSSFNKGESSAVYLSSRDLRNEGSTKVGSHRSGLNYGIGTQCSNDLNESKKEYALVKNLRATSAHFVQPSLVEDYFASNGRLVIGANAEGSLKGIKDVVHGGSTGVPVLAKEHVLGASSSGVGLLTETSQNASKSLSTPPKIDVQTVINAMHDQSELLVQNFSNGLHSLNEHEHDIIQLIINKLYVLSTNWVGQRAPMPESTQTATPFCPYKSTEHCKSSSMEFRVTWTKTMAAPHEPENQNYHDGQKSCYTAFTEKGLNSFSSCSDVGVEKSKDMVQVISKALSENRQIEEDMHPQALVYKNLWLKAEAALCGLKYKTCAWSLKFDGMDGYKSIKK